MISAFKCFEWCQVLQVRCWPLDVNFHGKLLPKGAMKFGFFDDFIPFLCCQSTLKFTIALSVSLENFWVASFTNQFRFCAANAFWNSVAELDLCISALVLQTMKILLMPSLWKCLTEQRNGASLTNLSVRVLPNSQKFTCGVRFVYKRFECGQACKFIWWTRNKCFARKYLLKIYFCLVLLKPSEN